MSTTTQPAEQLLDEAKVAEAVADYSARLLSLDGRREVAQYDAQRVFDAVGLPQALYCIEQAS